MKDPFLASKVTEADLKDEEQEAEETGTVVLLLYHMLVLRSILKD